MLSQARHLHMQWQALGVSPSVSRCPLCTTWIAWPPQLSLGHAPLPLSMPLCRPVCPLCAAPTTPCLLRVLPRRPRPPKPRPPRRPAQRRRPPPSPRQRRRQARGRGPRRPPQPLQRPKQLGRGHEDWQRCFSTPPSGQTMPLCWGWGWGCGWWGCGWGAFGVVGVGMMGEQQSVLVGQVGGMGEPPSIKPTCMGGMGEGAPAPRKGGIPKGWNECH